MEVIWKETTIGNAPIHIGDGNYSSMYPKSSEFVPSGVPFITASDFRNGRISPEGFRFISPEQHATLKKGHLKNGDILIVTRGNGVGNVAWVDPEFEGSNINAQLVLLRTDESEIHNRFLYYLLSSRQYQDLLVSFASGSAQPQIPIKSLVRVPIQYPSITEQHDIAEFLSVLDDKIELNRRMNRTLESMARAVFRQWFVENEEADDWEVGTVGDVLKRISVGKKYDFKTALPEGKIPILDQSHFTIIGYHNEEPGVIASLDNPVVVFSNHRCYTDIIHFPFSAIQNVLPFVGEGVNTRWLYHATDGIITYSEYKGHYPEFISKPLVIPPEELTQKFGEFVKPLHIKIMRNKEESRTLASLRDSLLPKLIRGEVRVKDLEHNI